MRCSDPLVLCDGVVEVCMLQDQFIPPDLVLAGLELQCSAEWKALLQCAMLWTVCLFSCSKPLWHRKKNGKKFIPFSMHILRLDYIPFHLHKFVCCVQQEISTSGNPFPINSEREGKFITSKHMYTDLVTSSINDLNTLLSTGCSVMPCASSAALFYFSWELWSIFGINPLASNFLHCCSLLAGFCDFQRWSGKELFRSLISFLFSAQKWQASHDSAPLLWKSARFKDHRAFYNAPLPE